VLLGELELNERLLSRSNVLSVLTLQEMRHAAGELDHLDAALQRFMAGVA